MGIILGSGFIAHVHERAGYFQVAFSSHPGIMRRFEHYHKVHVCPVFCHHNRLAINVYLRNKVPVLQLTKIIFFLILGFCVAAIPLAWKSYQVIGKFTIMPDTGGIALYIGNNPDTDKTIAIRPDGAGTVLVTWLLNKALKPKKKPLSFSTGYSSSM